MKTLVTMRLVKGCALSAVMLAFATPAFACSIMPPPPPPEAPAGTSPADVAALNLAWGQSYTAQRVAEDQAWKLKQQVRLFDDAKSLVIVRYDREAKVGKGDDAQTVAVLKPVRWVKGQGKSAEFQLGMSQPPPCGQMVGHAAYYGKPGEVFLVYLSGNVLRQADVLEAYALDRIVEPRTLAALTGR